MSPSNPEAAADPAKTGVAVVPESLRAPRPGSAGLYLLVFEGDSSRIFSLPEQGEVRIGRSEEADLVLRDNLVSRQHAALTVEHGSARLRDLGSQNGTLVNGEPLQGPRLLAAGDTVTICSVSLVFHGAPTSRRASRTALDLGGLRARIEEELERGRRFGRPFTLLALVASEGLRDAPRVADILARQLRLMDVMGWAGPDQLAILLPESDAEAGARAADRLLATLGPHVPGLKAGFALYPRDGCDADTLVAGARAAAASASAGGVATLSASARTRDVGEASVLVVDPAMVRLYDLIERLARADLPVLIHGETGTGKELAASALHHWSPRRAAPLVALNCAAMPETLVESELFGHERGAFSGAVASKAGLFEAADHGTLFLDEVGELSPAMQAKLLRVLETKRFSRIGDSRERQVDVRIVGATNRNLERDVQEGRFRQDLYFRLNAARLWLPPLRDRRLEIPLLAQVFLTAACAHLGRPAMQLAPEALEALAQHRWPGNVRELRNLMEFLAASVAEPAVERWHLSDRLDSGAIKPPEEQGQASHGPETPPPRFVPIEDEVRALEWARMREALSFTGGNKTRAAALIAMPLRTFLEKLKRYGEPGASPARRRG